MTDNRIVEINKILKAVSEIGVSQAIQFHYTLQCRQADSEWFDWMPDDHLKRFRFEVDAIKEAQDNIAKSVPAIGYSWQVLFVATVSEVVQVVRPIPHTLGI